MRRPTIFYAPVTTGSEHDPLPIGEWKVTGVQFNPTFHYNPDLFWDADPSHTKAKLPPGPNNPVGLVWIDLTKEHYGIHGTPEPSTIGQTAVAWLRPADELGRAQARRPGQAGHARRLHGIAPWTSRHHRARARIRTFAAGAGCGFLAGAFVGRCLVWQFGNVIGTRAASRQRAASRAIRRRALGRRRGRCGSRGHRGGRPETAVATSGAAPVARPAPSPEPVLTRSGDRALGDRDLLVPVEGVQPDQLVRSFARGARRPAARSDRHPGAAQHAGRGGRGRHDRPAVPQQGRRHHDLSVRPDRAVLLLLRPPRALRRRAGRREAASARARSSATSARRAMPLKTRPTCTSPSSGSPRRSAGGRARRSTRTTFSGSRLPTFRGKPAPSKLVQREGLAQRCSAEA